MTNDGGLFFMQILIDKVSFMKSACISDKDFRTYATVTVPSVDPFEICVDDPEPGVAQSGGPLMKTFHSGKSGLFFLKDEDIANAMSEFPVHVTVYQSLPCVCLPPKKIMGQATIDLTKEFVQTRNKYLEDPVNDSSQALKDSFQIVSLEGGPAGTIVIFIRISCFGKFIITRFQDPGVPSLGAERWPSIVDRPCNPQTQYLTSGDRCVCCAARIAVDGKGVPGIGRPCQHCGGSGADAYPKARNPCSEPCEEPADICYYSGPKPRLKKPMVCRNMVQYCMPVLKDCCPTGEQDEFQMTSDTCDMKHKQRAHFHFTSEGVGDVSRDEPGQLVPTTAEDYPGVVYDMPQQVIKQCIGKVIEQPV